eukprot:Sdes_comp19826_c0_seq1m12004
MMGIRWVFLFIRKILAYLGLFRGFEYVRRKFLGKRGGSWQEEGCGVSSFNSSISLLPIFISDSFEDKKTQNSKSTKDEFNNGGGEPLPPSKPSFFARKKCADSFESPTAENFSDTEEILLMDVSDEAFIAEAVPSAGSTPKLLFHEDISASKHSRGRSCQFLSPPSALFPPNPHPHSHFKPTHRRMHSSPNPDIQPFPCSGLSVRPSLPVRMNSNGNLVDSFARNP